MCQDPEAGKSLVGLKNRKKPSVVAMSGMREVRRRQGRTWVSLGLMLLLNIRNYWTMVSRGEVRTD